MSVLETAFALKRLPECTSRHTGTLDSRRFLSIPVDSAPLGLGMGNSLPVTE